MCLRILIHLCQLELQLGDPLFQIPIFLSNVCNMYTVWKSPTLVQFSEDRHFRRPTSPVCHDEQYDGWWMQTAVLDAISSLTSESAGTPSILGHLPGSMSGLCFLRLPSRPNTYKLRQHQSLLSDTHARPVTVGQSVWELGRLSRSSENHQLLLCSEKGWYHQV